MRISEYVALHSRITSTLIITYQRIIVFSIYINNINRKLNKCNFVIVISVQYKVQSNEYI